MSTNLTIQAGAPPPVANDRGPDRVFAPVSDGPHGALTMAPTVCGAIPIEDAHGNIIGWATDHAGHTTEQVHPEGLTPAEIETNARLFAEAWEMRGIIGAIAAIEPAITAGLMLHGMEPDATLSLAARKARRILARIYAGTPRR